MVDPSAAAPLPAPDSDAFAAVVAGASATPRGVSFGRLVPTVAWLASCQGQAPARPITAARAVIVAGEHGLAHALESTAEYGPLSAFAVAATAEQVNELNMGAGPAATAARAAGVAVRVVADAAASPSGDITREDALSEEAAQEAFERGLAIADEEVDGGCDLLIPGDIGVGNSTVAAAIVGTILSKEPVAIVGPGSGADDEMWKTKVSALRDAMFRVRNFADDPWNVARLAGSADFLTLVGLCVRAAQRRTPLLIDGAFVTAALLIADRLYPGVHRWALAASVGPEHSQRFALADMDLEPLLDLQLRTGQATGALLALPLLRTSIELLAD